MKFLEKLSLALFSIILSILSIALILIIMGVVPATIVVEAIALLTKTELAFEITLGVTIIILILSLKYIFFGGETEENANGVVLENSAGKLVISKETLENLIASTVKEVAGIDVVTSRTVLDKNNNVIVYVTTLVSKDSMIKDVSAQIQDKIKDRLSKTADLEVKQVNVKIKNITNKKLKGLPAGDSEEDTNDTVQENNSDNE